MAKDYYEILGVSKKSSPDEIKRAFRNLARKHHPDVNKEQGSTEKFKEINEAYQILSDPQKKQQYDTFGSAGPGTGGFTDFNSEGFGGFEGFGDIFDMFFGGQGAKRGRSSSRTNGEDLQYEISITLEDAFNGTEKELDIAHYIACQTCKGSGAKHGTSPTRCSSCGGSGQVRTMQRTMLGSFTQVVACPTCHGAGEYISSPCPDCRGSGKAKGRHKVKIKIPAGIESGNNLRVQRAGNQGIRGGAPGDLYVQVHVKPHNLFERDGADIVYKTKVTFVQAALGIELNIPLIDGKASLKIPSGTQPNTTFKLKGKGMNYLRGSGRGDQYVMVEIATPVNLTDEQINLLENFSKLRKE
ncbi:MAG: molecular chaperone DnaJ [Candidatus Saganbacteria bacterium]|uniref:Chaperone protein DnaJ n=1 Tax=Candidatus Saganbacteria bacterium TaxID=2575572 RepID=A0A833L0Y4_UNCSA|nr:MAG: molecular chaperone DnaJ [Candidatus Saganbacteria bacterium]